MGIFLHGLELKNYRGIGPEPQMMAPFGEFNIFVGANNSGKSTVLSFIYKHLPVTKENPLRISRDEDFIGEGGGPRSILIGYPVTFLDDLQERILSEAGFPPTYPGMQKRAFQRVRDFLCKEGLFWYSGIGENRNVLALVRADSDRTPINSSNYRKIWHQCGYADEGNLTMEFRIIESVIPYIESVTPPSTPTHLIPAKREIGKAGEPLEGWGGMGIIDHLAAHQNPGHSEQEKKQVFAKINAFLQTVTGKPDAQIEIPHDRAHILVHMDGKTLPLDRLGTGIHEVILIAAACTLVNKEIICIEEPENHLHPVLQRKLIAYLRENTDNQYFIATHSAAFIDMEGAEVFHVENDGVQTRVRRVSLKAERRAVCDVLGYKASDLVQANAIIWVEGPSDRIYLKHWLKAVAPELEEGTHFSIMFYGGRLLNHLSANKEDVDTLIDLLAMNKNTALIMDSDREKKGAHLGETKRRLVKELGESGFAWVTEGREIENYVPETLLKDIFEELGQTRQRQSGPRQYQRVLELQGSQKGARKYADKVKVAQSVAERDADLSELDLKKKVNELAGFIRKANGLSAA